MQKPVTTLFFLPTVLVLHCLWSLMRWANSRMCLNLRDILVFRMSRQWCFFKLKTKGCKGLWDPQAGAVALKSAFNCFVRCQQVQEKGWLFSVSCCGKSWVHLVQRDKVFMHYETFSVFQLSPGQGQQVQPKLKPAFLMCTTFLSAGKVPPEKKA